MRSRVTGSLKSSYAILLSLLVIFAQAMPAMAFDPAALGSMDLSSTAKTLTARCIQALLGIGFGTSACGEQITSPTTLPTACWEPDFVAVVCLRVLSRWEHSSVPTMQ